jgi:hypothetical protein
VWRDSIRWDKLEEIFRYKIEEEKIVDLEPIKIMPTWDNNRIGESRV